MTTQSPVLREFTDATRRHFSFLISDFGFSEAELPNDKDINEFQVRYLSARVLVTGVLKSYMTILHCHCK